MPISSSKINIFILLALLSAAFAPGCKSTDHAAVKGFGVSAVLGVPPVTPNTYKSVVKISGGTYATDPTPVNYFRKFIGNPAVHYATSGTGFFVAKNLIASAAHVAALKQFNAYKDFKIGRGVNGDEREFFVPVEQVTLSPGNKFDFAGDEKIAVNNYSNDFAFYEITDSRFFATADEISSLDMNGAKAGDVLVPAGFGLTDWKDSNSAGTKRAGLVVVDSIDSEARGNLIHSRAINLDGTDSPALDTGTTPVNGTTHGDSGGPLFRIDQTTGTMSVVGLVRGGPASQSADNTSMYVHINNKAVGSHFAQVVPGFTPCGYDASNAPLSGDHASDAAADSPDASSDHQASGSEAAGADGGKNHSQGPAAAK